MTANPMTDAIGADEFWGFEHNPTKLLIEQYQHIAQQEMANLPLATACIRRAYRAFTTAW